jgi:hypothetical protein
MINFFYRDLFNEKIAAESDMGKSNVKPFDRDMYVKKPSSFFSHY